MPRPPVTDKRREQILDGLFEAMAAQGSDAASVTEIAARAGRPRGALHYYFKSKDEMRRALMRRMGERYLLGMREALAGKDGKPHPEALRRLVKFHFLGTQDQTAKYLSVWIDFWGQAPADPELAELIASVQSQARSIMADALTAGGSTAKGRTLLARATVAQAILEGLVLQWRVCKASEHPFDTPATVEAANMALKKIALEGT